MHQIRFRLGPTSNGREGQGQAGRGKPVIKGKGRWREKEEREGKGRGAEVCSRNFQYLGSASVDEEVHLTTT